MLRRPELQVVSLSFLDLLCCAFGAVILLVLLLIPGAGNTEAADQDWLLVMERTIPMSANYEDVRVRIYDDGGTDVDEQAVAADALPLTVTQQVQSDIRAQFIPIFRDSRDRTELEGIRCRVFARGASTPKLGNGRIYVSDGGHLPFTSPLEGK
jgi:hypothetical protein